MEINTSLEIYDSRVITALKQRFYSVPEPNWNYAPPDLAFRMAYDKFGDDIIPLYNVFRIDVPQLADERYSLGGFTIPITTEDKTKSIEMIKVFLKYQIDFFSNSMYDMNMSIMDFFRFKKNRQLVFNFDDIGLAGEDYPSEVIFEDPEDQSGINDDKVYQIGRYFRYTYILTLDAVLFDISTEVQTEQIVFDLYTNNNLPTSKVDEVVSNKQE
jgi:hypothetical protein